LKGIVKITEGNNEKKEKKRNEIDFFV